MINKYTENITKEAIMNLPLIAFEGEIHVVDDQESLNNAIAIIKEHQILGFDTEKKPTFRKGDYNPTAMVQLSTQENAFLFRLNKIGYPQSLFKLFSDPSITKIGISLDDDVKELIKLNRFKPAGFIDLNETTEELGVIHNGVRKLAAIFLEGRIAKNQQTSNWENETLTPAQKKYAATDAWVCIEIYLELIRKGFIS